MPNTESETMVPLDVGLFETLDTRAVELANNFNAIVERLQKRMVLMATATSDAEGVYKASIQELSTEIDQCTNQMVQLISQCDELDKDLSQLSHLSKQMSKIDR
ncbi:uncharacterized protein BYT42DRAFT_613275 [Radiomyces spectabilis]|uniref:uncharacterized protein n=1 Tax=Radiomyces spectabilis TaxID=64574 RepID=UPI00221EC6D1|nr:uncharacterized protein BYT42DRAFT_613275 [Radiomyces spectabilis]KAI8381502.1 hypothetical protein BYT42DRAFT_613275 [Radiomyces spectabilis]